MQAAYERGDFAWLSKKADVGNNAEAEYFVSKMYLYGYGVTESKDMAFIMCKMAAEGGWTMAENNLGVMLSKGEGTDRDVAAGIGWL